MRDVFRRIWMRRSAAVGLVIISLIIVVALLAPYISPHDPIRQNLMERLQPPGGEHILGTDHFGRDLLSRMVYGARISLLVGVVAVSVAVVLGGVTGLLAGYLGGAVDNILMRMIDVLMAFPLLLLAIVFIAMLEEGLLNLMIAVGLSSSAPFARLVRGQVLSLRQQEFVEAARAMGSSPVRIMLRHIMINSLSPLIVFGTLRVATVILTEASLSFLGLGVPPPTPTWGGMVAEGTRFLQRAPWLSIIPGVGIMVTVLAFNLFGDGLRDALDPKLRTAGDVSIRN